MNRKIWDLYKQSKEYEELVNLFNQNPEDVDSSSAAVFQFALDNNIYEEEVEAKEFVFDWFSYNFILQGYEFDMNAGREDYIRFVDEFELFPITRDEKDELVLAGTDKPDVAKDNYRVKNSYIPAASLFFYYNNPFFKPVLYMSAFYRITRSCRLLGITLPAMPKARDYRGAMIWYYDICEEFRKFQQEYGMTDAEFCACLYGLGESLHDENEDGGMPRPVNVWLTGASKEDYAMLEQSMEGGGQWNCNENTRRGDIVVLYAVSPHSCIHSIWRADSENSFNPFAYRQCKTKLTDGVKVPPVKLAELKADPVFGTLPMLNNNLQGINGKMLPSWAYSALLKMIGAKGGDLERIPVLYETKGWDPGVVRLEEDVENNILIPALKDLGYTEDDWKRQMRLKSGRKEEREIPDFVFFPHGEKQFENSPMVIEAKLHMGSEKERKDAYRQAQSYARMMKSGIFCICDDEKLIVFKETGDGSFDYGKPCFEQHWAAIFGDVDIHSELMRLIGASVVKGMLKK